MAKNSQNQQAAVIGSLASTIQNKIILPAEEHASSLNKALAQADERISRLEETTASLNTSLARIKLAALLSLLVVAALAVSQAIIVF